MVTGKVQDRKVETKKLRTKTFQSPTPPFTAVYPSRAYTTDFLLLPLLVLHIQRSAIPAPQFHLHLMKLPIVCAGRRRV